MISYMIFGVVAIAALAGLFGLVLKYRLYSWIAWIGTLLMIAATVLNVTISNPSFIFIDDVLFSCGVVLLMLGMVIIVGKQKSKSADYNEQMHAKIIGDILEVAASRESLIELLNYSLDRFLEVFSLNSGAIHIYHRPKNKLVMGAFRGLIPSYAKRFELIEPGQTAIGRVVQNKRVLIIRDLKVSPDYQFFGGKSEGYSFLAVAPIIVEESCWGVITFLGRQKYHRGIFSIDQLEQFGQKLGQALVLGRENRRVSAAYTQLSNIVDLYNKLFGNIKKALATSPNIDDSVIFQILQTSSSRLFGGSSFILIKLNTATARCVYRYRRQADSNSWAAIEGNDIPIKRLSFKFTPNNYFSLNEAGLAGIIPTGFFKNKMLIGYGFSFSSDFSGVVIIDNDNPEDCKSYNGDLMIIANLFTLAFCRYRINNYFAQQQEHIAGSTRPEIKLSGVAQDLSSVFTGISGNIQLMLDQLSRNGETIKANDYSHRLETIEKAALKGLSLLNKVDAGLDPNLIIQDILNDGHEEIAFYPGTKLPAINNDTDDFGSTLKAIVTGAIAGNKIVRIKTSAEDGHLALTIEGQMKAEFPTPAIAEKARRHQLILNIIRNQSVIKRFTDINSTNNIDTKPQALTIEHNVVISDLLEDFLERIGYRNRPVNSGRDSLIQVKTLLNSGEHFDVAIIDMTLDDISGLELCREIKNIDKGIYTVIISSWGVSLQSSALKDAGVDAVLHKPFRLEQLRNVLPKDKTTDAAKNR